MIKNSVDRRMPSFFYQGWSLISGCLSIKGLQQKQVRKYEKVREDLDIRCTFKRLRANPYLRAACFGFSNCQRGSRVSRRLAA